MQHRKQQYHEKYIVSSDWEQLFRRNCYAAGIKYIDSHCHIDMMFQCHSELYTSFEHFKDSNWRTFTSEFAGCITIFCDPRSFNYKGSLFCTLSREENIWIGMGCHPKKVKYLNEYRFAQLEECVNMSAVIAVGEIGLDYSGTFFKDSELQIDMFRKQIRLALKVQKPIIIHCRDAEVDGLQILKEECPPDWPIHLHCYTNYFQYAKKWLTAFSNLYIGLTPKVTYPTSSKVHDTARRIPLNRLLLETDSPYFIPNMVPRNAMQTSNPSMAFAVAQTVAELKGIPIREILQACLENTQNLYRITYK